MPIDINQLRELLSAIAQTDIGELTLKSDDFELTVRRGINPLGTPPASSETTMAVAAAVPTPNPSISSPAPNISTPETSPSPVMEPKGVEISSPMVGTFYRSPAPDEPPFVEIGDRIRTTQTVCIIEAMKLMNEIESEVSGQVLEILVENGQPVEFGQTLMRVKPD
ncbi:MAG: acetyl-CoA carboxylase biotin carboxyl carrier protein [Cyanobacteriota bacterium]|nr:acetyl-CoA carboxylase biotin carboxyl carrier protein [Cyanobacteriota bacterium]